MFKRLGMLCRLGWLGGMVAAAALSAPAQELLPLKEGWQLRSSAETPDKGEALSQPGYGVEGWHRVSVPTTLLAALAENGVYPDPFYGDNLTKIPGYKPDRWLAMSPDSPFYPSWWYRTEFTVPESMRGKHVVLHVDGINYKANVWLNGTRVADDSKVVGMFRRFEFPVTEALKYGEPNALAIEVTGPGHIEDKPYRTKQLEATTGWDDHNPQPPDLNTGIWQEVYLTATGPVDLMHPYVATDLDLPSLDTARLTVSVDAVNRTDREQAVQLEGEIKGATFSDGQPVAIALQDTLKPGETKTLRFEPVTLDKPRLWWPHPVGPQDLYDLRLSARAGDEASDTEYVRFGVREATTYINDEGWRGYRVNGRDILIRGGAWMTADMLLRLHPRQYDGLVRHAREANLNMLRSEGFSIRETDDMYSLCDAYGVMVTQQIFGRSIPDEQLAIDNIRDTLLRIRNHPSLVHFLGHDETFPTETLDKAYRDMIAELTPDRTYQPHSGAFDVDERHETGGTRTGTRELWTYAGPAHYYTHKNDGAWGFAQSGGIGGVFAPLDSMKRMMPESALWPPTNETWSLHTVIQGVKFFDEVFAAMTRRYGEAKNIEELVRKGEVMNYESARGMFEAYARNKYSATGITPWKYDAAWPAALTWHYVDWYLQPTGAYFGAKKACEALHAQYSYDDHSVWVVNSLYEPFENLKVTARVFNLDMTEKLNKSATVSVGPDGKTQAFVIEWPEGLSKTHFLRLDLEDASGKRITDNFYWLSTVPDVPDVVNDQWNNFFTKPKSTMDFTDLATLPAVALRVESAFSDGQVRAMTDYVGSGLTMRLASQAEAETPEVWEAWKEASRPFNRQEKVVRATVSNPSSNLAFAVRLAVTKGEGGSEVAPAFWSENYFSLLPGESRTIEGTFYADDLEGAEPVLKVEGWNVE